MAIRKVLTGWAVAFLAVGVVFTGLFTLQAPRSGKPFRYLKFDYWTVHSLRDKVALTRFLRSEFGITEDLFLTRVHTDADLFHIPEESLDYEIRAAIETTPSAPPPDPSLYYFVFESEDAPYLAGEYEEVDLRLFGGLGVLVYRPRSPVPADWQVDPPISWWWY